MFCLKVNIQKQMLIFPLLKWKQEWCHTGLILLPVYRRSCWIIQLRRFFSPGVSAWGESAALLVAQFLLNQSVSFIFNIYQDKVINVSWHTEDNKDINAAGGTQVLYITHIHTQTTRFLGLMLILILWEQYISQCSDIKLKVQRHLNLNDLKGHFKCQTCHFSNFVRQYSPQHF